jgi:hypothetical protein
MGNISENKEGGGRIFKEGKKKPRSFRGLFELPDFVIHKRWKTVKKFLISGCQNQFEKIPS